MPKSICSKTKFSKGTHVLYIRENFLNVQFLSHRITISQVKLRKLQKWDHLMLLWRTWAYKLHSSPVLCSRYTS